MGAVVTGSLTSSIGEQSAAPNRVDPVFAEHEGSERRGREQSGEGAVENVQPAGIGTEGRQNQAMPVAGKATAADRPALAEDAGGRVQVAGDLATARGSRRLVPKEERADGKCP